MLNRIAWTLLMLSSLAILGGVALFFYRELSAVEARRQAVVDLRRLEGEEGPCAALLRATTTRVAGQDDFELVRNVDVLREGFAAGVLGDEDDRKGVAALMAAADEGLLSLTLCEQIKIASDLEEPHPVMALLRFTREKDPCEEALALDQVISGLGSQRALLLRGLMEDVDKLSCLTPAMVHEVAVQVANMLHDDPQAFDDLDVLRIAGFLTTWAPMQAAQVGCRIDAFGDISRLGSVLGCSPDHQSRVLTRYRYLRPLPRPNEEDPLPPGQEVLLIWRTHNRCEVRPAEGPARVLTVACDDLELVSTLDIAVLIEPIAYGVVRADLISGLAHYSARTKITRASVEEPSFKSWFAYSRTGQAVGITQVTSLEKLAEQAREDIPDNPLRTFCHQAGARYCYDVDWTQLVARLDDQAAVYLSRPLDVFLREAAVPDEVRARWYREAFGKPAPAPDDAYDDTSDAPEAGPIVRVYELGRDRDGSRMILELRPGGIALRWRFGNGPWHAQSFGEGEGGAVPPAARLMAAMDIQGDGRPELILQRSERGMAAMDIQGDGRPELILQRSEREQRGTSLHDLTDEVVLVHLDDTGSRFIPLTRLTIHEY